MPFLPPMLLYLHGFCSSPASWKARLLAEHLAARGMAGIYRCPALPPTPEEALSLAESIIAAAEEPVVLVGSSLGGHYATWLAERHGLKAVLVNPAVVDCLDLGLFLGAHRNFHTGEPFTFTPPHAAQLLAQVVPSPSPERYLLLAEEGDEVLDCRRAQERYAGCRQVVLPGGDHSFTRFPDFIPQILEFAGL